MSSLIEPAAPAARPARIRVVAWTAGAAGLIVAVALIARSGLPEIAALLRVAGWRLLWLVPLHVIPLALDANGWRRLLPRRSAPGRTYLTGAAVVREIVSAALPLRVGGEVAGIRLLMRRGVGGLAASASVVVEVTLWLLTQMLFALVGLVLLIGSPHAGNIPRYASIGLLLVAVAVVGFLLVQRHVGLFALFGRILTKVAGPNVVRIVGDPGRLDRAISDLYRDRRAVASCMAWQMSGFLVGAIETWITLRLFDHPIGFASAMIVESLSVAVQSATFVVPAGLGTQEASLVLLGATVGIPAATALALSMARRARQIALGVPAIVAWYWVEGRAAGAASEPRNPGGSRLSG